MGRMQNGFSGSFSGSLGPVIGYMWRGKWCVRTRPSQFHDARTEQQLERRELFRQTVRFAAHARQVLRRGLRVPSLDAHITEYNYFMRINKGCFSLVDGRLSVDYENLTLSEGPVAPVAFAVPQLIDDVTISVGFEKNPLHRAIKSDDLVYLTAYCPELDSFDISSGALRRHNCLTMSLHPAWAGKEVHLWGFVVDNNGRASMSQYLGCGVLDADVIGNEADGVALPDEDAENGAAEAAATVGAYSESRPSTGEGPAFGSGTLPDT